VARWKSGHLPVKDVGGEVRAILREHGGKKEGVTQACAEKGGRGIQTGINVYNRKEGSLKWPFTRGKVFKRVMPRQPTWRRRG